jgi:hypothetical protein
VKLFGLCLCLCLLTAGSALAQSLDVEAKKEGDEVKVFVEGALFTSYKFADKQKYPYFWPVVGPASGKSITTESSMPYPHHHSLFFGCDRVNEGNYWQDEITAGQIVSKGPKIEIAKGYRVVFTDRCDWRKPKKRPIIEDTRKIEITAPGKDTRVIDFEITLEALKKITIEKTNHSLFSARVIPKLSCDSSGVLVNAEGKKREEGTFGVASPWCDYSGTWENKKEGIAILQNPQNRWYPCKWFTRDYGFFSPTPMYWLEGDKLELPRGEKLTLKYRVIVHAGDARDAKIDRQFEKYEKAARSQMEE